MGDSDYWRPGSWNARCSMCGQKRKADLMVRNWQGLYRCPEHNEERQPQDFARGIPDNMGVPWAQMPGPQFVRLCGFNGQSGIAGYADAGCMIAGNPNYIPGL